MKGLPDNQGRITEGIKTRIIRYIHDARLQAGDRLPGYDEMRAIFQCSGTSITRAMNLLERDGVVEVRSHVGTFVRKPDARTVFGRTIGVIRLSFDGSPFLAFYHHYLQIELNHFGCDTIFFGVDDDPDHFEMQRRLACSIEHGQVQGILDTTFQQPEVFASFRKHGVPFIMAGGNDHNLPGACLDLSAYTAAAAAQLAETGCRCIALVYRAVDQNNRVLEDSFRKEAAASGCKVMIYDCETASEGCALAHCLAKSDDRKRPDGICFVDENVAVGFTVGLAAAPENYRPGFVSTVLKPLQTIFSLPPTGLYETDVKALANAAVCRLLAEIRGEECERTVKIPLLPAPERCREIRACLSNEIDVRNFAV